MKKKLLLLLFLANAFFMNAQNVGIGTPSPNAKLSVSANGTELTGTAMSSSFRTNAGTLGGTTGNEISLANIGFMTGVNHTSLGIRAYRNSAGTDWTTTALLLGYDVDNTVRASSAFLALGANGNVGIGTTNPTAKLHVSAGNASLGLFGPNAAGGSLYVGASGNQGVAFTAQVIASDGNLHLDPAPGKNIYIGYYQPRDIYLNPNGGNVGLETANPVFTLDVIGNTTVTGNFVNTATTANNFGMQGICTNTPGYGYGAIGRGGWVGVAGQANLSGSGDRYGVFGEGLNGTSNNFGVHGTATGGTNAFGIYGTASGGTNNYAGYFQGNVYSSGSYLPSDRKLKNDIKPLSGALLIINQLNPSVYTYKTNEYKQMHLSEGLHYGLIADEVQQVMPAVVKKTMQPAEYENHDERNGKKLSDQVEFNAVNYTEMIPILIGGMKEQQAIIEKQQQQINELQKELQLIKEKLK